MHGEFTQDGYEGAMIRAADGLYTIADRSDSLFKYKLFYDKECKVIDVWEDANGNAMLTCLWNHNDPTSEFRCTPKRTHNERKAMLGAKDAIVGCWITVKYQELSFAKHEGGIPTFNCGLDFRECDEDGNPIV
jgi:DNA ligase-1